MGFERLINTIEGVAVNSGGLAEFDLFEETRKFFSRADIQKWMIETNQDNLYDKQEDARGNRMPPYTDRTAKHKRRRNLPDKYYTYYETGETYESLTVYVEDTFVAIYPDHERAPEYAHLLDANAWGIQKGDLEEKREEILTTIQTNLRAYING